MNPDREDAIKDLEDAKKLAKEKGNYKLFSDLVINIAKLKGLFNENSDKKGIIELDTRKMTQDQIILNGLEGEENVARKS